MNWPSVPDALFELINGQEFDGDTVTAYLRLKTDFVDHLPAALIYSVGGSEGQIDRAEGITITTYGPGQKAVNVGNAIAEYLAGRPHETSFGLLDSVDVPVTPHDVPYVDAEINQANTSYTVRVRPL